MIPNAEKVALYALRGALDAPVYSVPPKGVSLPYVTAYRAGGNMSNIVTDAPLIIVNCYAADPFEAAELANRAREAMFDIRASWVDGVWVRWWEESGGTIRYPEPDIGGTRYQFNGVLTVATNTG